MQMHEMRKKIIMSEVLQTNKLYFLYKKYIEQKEIKACTYCMTYFISIKRICDIKRDYISIYRID